MEVQLPPTLPGAVTDYLQEPGSSAEPANDTIFLRQLANLPEQDCRPISTVER
jgi:hypothetical protein